MNQKSIEHIALYSLVLVGTLVVGVLARQFVLSNGVDDFSSSVAFFATVIVLMAVYASLQTTFNMFLLPRIEAFLLRFSAFQTMKNHNDTVSVPEAFTIEDSNQAIPNIIDPAPAAEETISEPSEYEVKISPVKVDSQLKSIDIMHFGWNVILDSQPFIFSIQYFTLSETTLAFVDGTTSKTTYPSAFISLSWHPIRFNAFFNISLSSFLLANCIRTFPLFPSSIISI